jgi:hypothetical protein
MQQFGDAIERAGLPRFDLLSGAGHDAMAMAAITDVAMLFTRCGNGGISHNPLETMTADDADIAARVLLDSCAVTRPTQPAAQRLRHLRDHWRPAAVARLAEQAHGRIPRRVVTFLHPAPVAAIIGQQQPAWLAHRAGQMRDRRVDADDQIQVGDDGRSVGEVRQLRAEHGATCRPAAATPPTRPRPLQADEMQRVMRPTCCPAAAAGASGASVISDGSERSASFSKFPLPRHARPTASLAAAAAAPMRHQFRLRAQIGVAAGMVAISVPNNPGKRMGRVQ